MTTDQRNAIRRLARCTFVPGTFDKRFVRSLSGYPEDAELTEKQTESLERLTHKYRGQLGRMKEGVGK